MSKDSRPRMGVVVPLPHRKEPPPFDPEKDRLRRERYLAARRVRKIGGAILEQRTYAPGEVITDEDQELEQSIFILEGSLDVFAEGRRLYGLEAEDILHPELFTHDGEISGEISSVRVVARTRVTAIVASPYDVKDPLISEMQRLARMEFIFDAMATALMRQQARLTDFSQERDAFEHALDDERGKRSAAQTELVQARARLRTLETRLAEIEEILEGEFWREVTNEDLEQGISWLPPDPDPTKNPPEGG